MKWRQEINEILARARFGERPKPSGRDALWAILIAIAALALMIAANDDRRRQVTKPVQRSFLSF